MKDENDEFAEVVNRLKAALFLTNDADVAERLGMKRTAFAERKRRGALPLKEIEALCHQAELSPAWVLRGRGALSPRALAAVEPLRKAADVVRTLGLADDEARSLQELLHHAFAGNRTQLLPLVRSLGLALAPRYDIAASAGPGAFVQVHHEEVVDVLAFRRDYLRELGVPPERVAVIAVRGDSMADTLHDGDLIIVDTSVVERKSAGVYVIVKGGSLLVKRLNFKMNGAVEIRSDNKAYAPETISAAEFEQVQLVGRMVRRVVR